MKRRPLPDSLVNETLAAATRQNMPPLFTRDTYRRWCDGQPMRHCHFGPVPPPECLCTGCEHNRLFAYFDQVAKTFGMLT